MPQVDLMDFRVAYVRPRSGIDMLKNWNLFGVKKKLKALPQNRILVALRVLFKISDSLPRPPPSPPPPSPFPPRSYLCKLAIYKLVGSVSFFSNARDSADDDTYW